MKYWTIQTADVWQSLCKDRVWRANSAFVEESWVDAYEWLVGQMKVRIEGVRLQGQMPVWIWRQWCGVKYAMPDLRNSGHLSAGTQGVRIELEIDEALVHKSQVAPKISTGVTSGVE